MITSVSYSQTEIIKGIIALHLGGQDIECDPTYSKGNFYKDGISRPKFKFDINPQTEDTVKASSISLPLENESLNSVMFDPPFLATTGKSLTLHNDSNKINKRFSVFPDEKSLHAYYVDSMREFYRVLKVGGTLIFKCQDKVSSGKQYLSHVFVINEAVNLGFYPKDVFILLAKNRIVADWQKKNQQHARKFHSYFVVLKKEGRKINYA